MSIRVDRSLFLEDPRVKRVNEQFTSDENPIKRVAYFLANKVAAYFPRFKTETYLEKLQDRVEKSGDIEAYIDLGILEELGHIKPYQKDQTQYVAPLKIYVKLDHPPEPVYDLNYKRAIKLLARLKELTPANFDQISYEWLIKNGKINKLCHRIFPKIEIISPDLKKSSILTVGCGHTTMFCTSKRGIFGPDSHRDQLTIDLKKHIGPDIKADFMNPKLFKLLPQNHFEKVWFENISLDSIFRKKSYKGCYDILRHGGRLEVDGATHLLRKPFCLDPEQFFKDLGFSKVTVEIKNLEKWDHIEVVAIK